MLIQEQKAHYVRIINVYIRVYIYILFCIFNSLCIYLALLSMIYNIYILFLAVESQIALFCISQVPAIPMGKTIKFQD